MWVVIAFLAGVIVGYIWGVVWRAAYNGRALSKHLEQLRALRDEAERAVKASRARRGDA
jgi:hypothetical protein